MIRALETVEILLEEKIVAVLRLRSGAAIGDICEALVAGGIRCVEVTMTVPNALDSIHDVATKPGLAAVGAGTVMTEPQTRQCIDAGAQFVVSPAIVPESVQAALDSDVAAIPGALTPTEILAACSLGASMVKIFPAAQLGPSYIAAIKAPLPDVLLMPTGGITADSARGFLEAGADVLCAGSWLVSDADVESGRFDEIERKARLLVKAVSQSRAGKRRTRSDG